jgi:hypothetical protein
MRHGNPITDAKAIDLNKAAFSIPEACSLFDVGRNTGYEAARLRRWPVIQVGDRTLRIPGTWVRQQLGLDESAQPAPAAVQSEVTAEPAPVSQPDDRAARAEAFGAWCDRSAKQLLRLPPDLLGKSRRQEIERHLDRHDWIDGDHVWISELLHKFAEHLARL